MTACGAVVGSEDDRRCSPESRVAFQPYKLMERASCAANPFLAIEGVCGDLRFRNVDGLITNWTWWWDAETGEQVGYEFMTDVAQECVDGQPSFGFTQGRVPAPGACRGGDWGFACETFGPELMMDSGHCVTFAGFSEDSAPTLAELCARGLSPSAGRCGDHQVVQWETAEGETVRIIHRLGRIQAEVRSRPTPSYCCDASGCASDTVTPGHPHVLESAELSADACVVVPHVCRAQPP